MAGHDLERPGVEQHEDHLAEDFARRKPVPATSGRDIMTSTLLSCGRFILECCFS